MSEALSRALGRVESETIAHYRHLHAHPELSWEEEGTARYVEKTLREIGYEPRRLAETGVVVDIPKSGGSDSLSEARILRADMDAVAVDENTGLDFASTCPGKMHACGHDAHTAILLSVAKVLTDCAPLPRDIRLVFQPAEEVSPSGSQKVIEEGVLEGVADVIGLHVWPVLPAGTIGFLPGYITSSAYAFECTLRGPGGHGARPFQTVDLIACATRIIPELLDLPRTTLDPLTQPAIVSVGMIRAGEALNVLPSELRFGGTMRGFDEDVTRGLGESIGETIAAHAESAGAEYEVELRRGPPAVRNDPDLTAAAKEVTSTLFGEDSVRQLISASMGSEDFGQFTDRVPGLLLRVGSTAPGKTEHPLHSSRFTIDERTLRVGVGVMAGLAYSA